jgi:hypothetical protein
MPLDTVTLVLSGDVLLADFAVAIDRFYELVKALSAEAGNPALNWTIDDLERSSALAAAKCADEPQVVERVVRAYGEVGAALETNTPIRFSPAVQAAAHRLRAIVGDHIESIRFETAERESTIRRSVADQVAVTLSEEASVKAMGPAGPPPAAAYGAVEGRIQTLTNRGGLRFTLFDLLHDKAVSCYLREGHEGVMRDAWGKIAIVEGLVSRDPVTGRPLTVRQVSRVTTREEPALSYRDARGASPGVTDLSPEQAIRRLRDA